VEKFSKEKIISTYFFLKILLLFMGLFTFLIYHLLSALRVFSEIIEPIPGRYLTNQGYFYHPQKLALTCLFASFGV